jgi:hypothetical protein
MVHPFSSSAQHIKVILEICTTFKGIPFGPAIIHHENPEK